MNKTKFTKGEWSTSVDDNIVMSQTGKIAYVYSGESIPYLEKRIANAHLIAAAPKLYAMVETLIGNYQLAASIADNEGYKTNYEQDKILVEKLLAEARGE